MNVRELIAELEKHDPDLPVAVWDWDPVDDWGLCEAEGVETYGSEGHPCLVLQAGAMRDY